MREPVHIPEIALGRTADLPSGAGLPSTRVMAYPARRIFFEEPDGNPLAVNY
ncbi:MAG: hypothetical protein ABI995_13730 [Acidobacteriota bacterium]